MIPSVLAQHVEQGIKDFLRTTFPVTTPFFSNILENFLAEPDNVFKGPFLDIQLPFQQGKGGTDYFADLPMQFPPYLHQENSFDRLSGKKIMKSSGRSLKNAFEIMDESDYNFSS